MGIRACINVLNQYDYGVFSPVNLFDCDRATILHVLVPFYITVFSRNPWAGFIWSYLGEAIEVILGAAYGGYTIFASGPGANVNNALENQFGSTVDDATIQGGIGALLMGYVFIKTFPAPGMVTWQNCIRYPFRFWFYTFFLGILVAVNRFYATEINGFRIGLNAQWAVAGGVALLIMFGQPKGTWKGYSWEDQLMHWVSWWFIVLILVVQGNGDYFFSGAVQTWLWSAVILLVMGSYSMWRWRWWRYWELDFYFEL
jgi:hypothetical protein